MLQIRVKTICFIVFLLQFDPSCCNIRLPIDNAHETMCPTDHKTCPDGSPHYLCEPAAVPQNCTNFKILQLTNGIRKQFIDGHNGVRNKVAKNFRIANMNLMYWSRELEIVASKYLMKCIVAKDGCDFIGKNNLRVNSNLHFRVLLISQWPSRVVRHWYTELGVNVKTGPEFLAKYNRTTRYANNFTQMIWPRSQFLGCGVARMYDGYLVACYYYPPRNKEKLKEHFILGPVCTHCPRNRPSCSLTFHSLCGVDIPLDDLATNLKANGFLYLLIFFIYTLLNFTWYLN